LGRGAQGVDFQSKCKKQRGKKGKSRFGGEWERRRAAVTFTGKRSYVMAKKGGVVASRRSGKIH